MTWCELFARRSGRVRLCHCNRLLTRRTCAQDDDEPKELRQQMRLMDTSQ